MLFDHPSHLPFTGLKSIQFLLKDSYYQNPVDSTLVITASIPSLDFTQKKRLIEEIKKYNSIIFWCYGDFLWNLDFFNSVQSVLVGKNITWVAASLRWKKLLSHYIPEANLIIHGHPFKASNNSDNRKVIRAKFELEEKDKLLFFAGRQNTSKNIPWLLKIWDTLKQNSTNQVKLVIAGSVCEYQALLDKLNGKFPSPFKSGLKSLKELHPNLIFAFNELSPNEVESYLQGADLAISASTFLEEDYGLFLREARATGCPVLASNWGGQSDLNDKGSFLFNFVYRDGSISLNTQEIISKGNIALNSVRENVNYNQKIIFSDISINRFEGFKQLKLIELKKMQELMLGF